MNTKLLASGLLLGLLSACGDQGVATIRIELADDLSGTVTTTSLLVPDAAGPVESASGGATWTDRTNLFCARGSFESLGELRLADIEFAASTGDGMNSLRVSLPRGEGARWPHLFVPRAAQRESVEQTFDPDGNLGSATTHLGLVIHLPGPVVSSGATPRIRGLTAEHEANRATLNIPVDRTATTGDPLEWHVSWK